MVHQPSLHGGLTGQVTDIEIHARELVANKKKLTEIYVKHTGRSYEELFNMMERDFYMDPSKAKEYSLIDDVVTERRKTGA